MKKYLYIYIAFSLLLIQPVQAQKFQSMAKNAGIGIKGMVNLADMTVHPSHQIDTKILAGFGGFAQMKLTDKFSFQPEVLISLQGGAQHTFASDVTDYEYITDDKLTYLLLPLMGQYYLNQFYVEAGLQPAFMLSATYHYQAIDNGEIVIDTHDNITDSFHGFDLSFNIGAGYQINDKLSAGIRYGKGLLTINKSNSISLKNSVFSFSLGYVIFN